MVPCVVSAVKSGATSLIRSDIFDRLFFGDVAKTLKNPPGIRTGGGFEIPKLGSSIRSITHPHGAAATAAAPTHAGLSDPGHNLQKRVTSRFTPVRICLEEGGVNQMGLREF